LTERPLTERGRVPRKVREKTANAADPAGKEAIMKDLGQLIIIAAMLTATSLPALAWRPSSGSASAERTVTTPGGKSFESSGSATYGGGSGSAERTMTTPGGKSYESSGSATYGDGSASGQRTMTGPNGQSYQSNATGSYGGGSGSVNRTVTTPNGGSYYGTGSIYRPPGW
jgi:hypothetical protein